MKNLIVYIACAFLLDVDLFHTNTRARNHQKLQNEQILLVYYFLLISTCIIYLDQFSTLRRAIVHCAASRMT